MGCCIAPNEVGWGLSPVPKRQRVNTTAELGSFGSPMGPPDSMSLKVVFCFDEWVVLLSGRAGPLSAVHGPACISLGHPEAVLGRLAPASDNLDVNSGQQFRLLQCASLRRPLWDGSTR